ncbi:type II secretion system protein [Burkholderia cenocepacia]|uniref:type II secretion system protein n=1 Tax=Burkholderia cenocepacia TaxID=95486 RepID=UPI002AB16038|nr:type II secretion system protein [Burkholderia cenocepacia]
MSTSDYPMSSSARRVRCDVARHERGFTLVEMLVALIVAVSLLSVAATLIKRQNTDIAATNAAEGLRVLGKAALLYVSSKGDLGPLHMSKPNDASKLRPYLPPNLASLSVGPFSGEYFVLSTVNGAHKVANGAGLVACTAVPSMSVASKIASLLGVNGVYVATRPNGSRTFSGTSGTLDPQGQFSRDFLSSVITAANLQAQRDAVSPASVVCYADSTEQAMREAQMDDVWLHRNQSEGHPEWNQMNASIDMMGHAASNVGALVMAPKGDIQVAGGSVLLESGKLKVLSSSGAINFNPDSGPKAGDTCVKGDMAVGRNGESLTCRLDDDGQTYRYANLARDVLPQVESVGGVVSAKYVMDLVDVVNRFPRVGDRSHVFSNHAHVKEIFIPEGGAPRNFTVVMNFSRSFEDWVKKPVWQHRSTVGHQALIVAIAHKGRGSVSNISNWKVLDYQQCHFEDAGTCRLTVRAYPGWTTRIESVWGGSSDAAEADASLDQQSRELKALISVHMDNPFQAD